MEPVGVFYLCGTKGLWRKLMQLWAIFLSPVDSGMSWINMNELFRVYMDVILIGYVNLCGKNWGELVAGGMFLDA
jgi:hypothetical protein